MFNFQDARRHIREENLFFYGWLFAIIYGFSASIVWWMSRKIGVVYTDRSFKDSQKLEFTWTVAPALVLCIVRYPSLRLLYLEDESHSSCVKTTGHQWYWDYDYSNVQFDSYLSSGDYRLLDTSNRLILQSNNPYLVLITSADVLHSWAVPTMSIKTDAVPGRVNNKPLLAKRPGLYFGQCREICGRNHSFMPISLECS